MTKAEQYLEENKEEEYTKAQLTAKVKELEEKVDELNYTLGCNSILIGQLTDAIILLKRD